MDLMGFALWGFGVNLWNLEFDLQDIFIGSLLFSLCLLNMILVEMGVVFESCMWSTIILNNCYLIRNLSKFFGFSYIILVGFCVLIMVLGS